MNRRNVLAAVGCLSASTIPAAASARTDDGTDEDDCEKIEIPTAKSGDEVIATEDVPKAWWEQVERSRDVEDELWEEFGDESWFERSGRSSGEDEICDRSEFVVTVYATDEDAARDHLDDERDGVPIEVEGAGDEPQPMGAEVDDGEEGDGDEEAEGDEDEANDDEREDDDDNETPSSDDENGDDTTDGNANDEDVASDDSDEGDSIPGFGVVGAVAGLGAAGYALANRRRDGDRS